jgi:parallel beta-helix repeat protein
METRFYYKRIVSILTVFFLLVVICGSGAAGKEITVGSEIGADFTSIQDAIYDVNTSNDDIIIVNSGTYYENVTVNKTLTLRGNDTGSGLPVVDAMQNNYTIILTANSITLEGFIVTNASNDAGIRVTSDNNKILNNYILSNNGYGIKILSSDNNNFTNNEVISNNEDGIFML